MCKMKKIASMMLAVVMVLSMGVTAMATSGTTPSTYTITITYEASGHTYEAYQIFTGDLDEQDVYSEYTGTGYPSDGTKIYTYDSSTATYSLATGYDASLAPYYYVSGTTSVLSNIVWGSGVEGSDLLNALKQDSTVVGKNDSDGSDIAFSSLFTNCQTAADVAKVLSDNNTNSTLAEQFAQLASEHLNTTVAGTSTGGDTADADGVYTYTITNLLAGYYLVKDKDGTVTAKGDSYTDIILEVVTDVAVSAKADTVTLDKTTLSTTDSTNETTADYDIGDNVPFTLTATLPSNLEDYSTYKMTFHDTLSDGLSFNKDSVEVAVYTLCANLTSFDNSTEYYTISNGTIAKVKTSTVDASSGTYYIKTVVSSSNGYDLYTYGYSVASSVDLTSTTTYYTYNGSTYEVVAKEATYDADTVYYVLGDTCYHKVSITSFETGTAYYTLDNNGSYTKVDTAGSTAPVSGTDYYVVGDCTFEVQIADAKSLYSDAAGSNKIDVASTSVIAVTYTAKLTADAANTENNDAYLEYSNNPNNGEMGITPKDKTTVLTFTLKVSKTDSKTGNPLEDAGFTLYKKADISSFESGITYYTYTNGKITEVASGTTYDSEVDYYLAVGSEVFGESQHAVVTITAFESGVTYYTKDNGTYTVVDTTAVTVPETGKNYYVQAENLFEFKGLGIGTYILSESTTPAGYNTMDDLYFVIDADTEENSSGDGQVKANSLTIKAVNGNKISEFTVDATTQQTISNTIENAAGSTLPSTGGIGTTIFYIVGTIMVLGAAVVLITRRRMRSAE